MNWKKWLTFDPYRKLWSLLGGRPWTYITRDLWEQAEYAFIIFFISAGFFVGLFWENIRSWSALHPILSFAALLGIFTIGYILGHIFWGTAHIPGQTGNNERKGFAWRRNK